MVASTPPFALNTPYQLQSRRTLGFASTDPVYCVAYTMDPSNTSKKASPRQDTVSNSNSSEEQNFQDSTSEYSMSTLVEKKPSRYQKVKNALSQAASIQSRAFSGDWPQNSIHSRAEHVEREASKQSRDGK